MTVSHAKPQRVVVSHVTQMSKMIQEVVSFYFCNNFNYSWYIFFFLQVVHLFKRLPSSFPKLMSGTFVQTTKWLYTSSNTWGEGVNLFERLPNTSLKESDDTLVRASFLLNYVGAIVCLTSDLLPSPSQTHGWYICSSKRLNSLSSTWVVWEHNKCQF